MKIIILGAGQVGSSLAENLTSEANDITIIAGSWACIRYAPAVIATTGKKDPGLIVADEVAGQAVTFFLAGFFILPAESPGLIPVTAAASLSWLTALKPRPVHVR